MIDEITLSYLKKFVWNNFGLILEETNHQLF